MQFGFFRGVYAVKIAKWLRSIKVTREQPLHEKPESTQVLMEKLQRLLLSLFVFAIEGKLEVGRVTAQGFFWKPKMLTVRTNVDVNFRFIQEP